MSREVVVNHIGLAVADVDRSRRFWTEAFGFECVKELDAPDEGTSQLLGLAKPIGLHAVYLRRGEFILELLHYGDAGLVEREDRVMNEPGLTHISLLVEDLPAALEKVQTLGGTVMEETRLGDYAVLIKDPDGQRVELLTHWERPG